MRATIYMGLSVDGFVARPDDRLDFLGAAPDGAPPVAPEPDALSFPAFMATVDVVVMGRRTFDVVRPFPSWPYGETPVIVLSRTLTAPPPGVPATVSVRSGEPEEIVRALEAEGVRHVYVDGALTARAFLAAGLVTDIVLTHVPVLIGEGITPWGRLPADVRLELVHTCRFDGQAVQSRYRVRR